VVPEVTLIQIARGEPLARYLRYEALNPIQMFALQKPGSAPVQPRAAEGL
jgi:precorrin-6B C5,15-methyltransferase / cobalt-precorrin-6B C5,C15-methyltransferase